MAKKIEIRCNELVEWRPFEPVFEPEDEMYSFRALWEAVDMADLALSYIMHQVKSEDNKNV